MATETSWLYKNGQPWHRDFFTESLDEQIDKRIDINFASVLLIDGGQGQGKTTLAVHIADFFNKKRGLPEVDLSSKNCQQLGLGGVDFISKFNKARQKGYPILIYDEAGDYSKASTLSWFNYQLSKMFQKIRSAKIIVLLCLPNFNILDNRLFDDEIIRGAIHCYGRQVTKNYGNFEVYDIEQMSWIRYWFNKLPAARRSDCYSKVSGLFDSHFKNLPPVRAKQLDILTCFGKDKERLEAEINMKGLVCVKDIVRETGKSEPWIRMKLGKLKVKPEEKLNNVNYYHKKLITIIERQIQR